MLDVRVSESDDERRGEDERPWLPADEGPLKSGLVEGTSRPATKTAKT